MNIEINAPKVDVQLKRSKVDVDTGTPVAKEYVERPAYTGPYSVTPGASAQTLATEGKRMTGDVTVQAVPGDYVGPSVPRQEATTITPTTSAQTAVAAGKYTEGAVTVGPIPPEYIVPTGTITITENGEGLDVSAYSTADIAVQDSVFVVTIDWDSSEDMWVPDKTFTEIYAAWQDDREIAVVTDPNLAFDGIEVSGYYDLMMNSFRYTVFDGAAKTEYLLNAYGLNVFGSERYGVITWNGSVLTVS